MTSAGSGTASITLPDDASSASFVHCVLFESINGVFTQIAATLQAYDAKTRLLELLDRLLRDDGVADCLPNYATSDLDV